ncbi:protein translocase subunit SecF [Marinihelvus fidelis]|uniref:Protein-export membrane protein SecF n=1 Tax=Marinihelvus fidelis TaxID=2613842 RepID=A0A5N0TFX5_9GAMM|nr:protein translocase subunit SecF [Marinihelvus fidelis]KAA9133975.1 protein translocase subunit SecF [Marinihelvus fidelis]
MRLLKDKTNIDFMGKRKITLVFSAILIIVALVTLPTMGLNFGLDFTGGTEVEVRFNEAPDVGAVRESLAGAGMDDATVQTFGSSTDMLVRIPPHEGDSNADTQATQVIEALAQDFPSGVEMRSSGFVGPQVGEELTEQGILAVIYALIGIFIYVMFRFQWRFSVGAVIAVIHDILVTLGMLAILQIDFDLTVVAALLAVVGYSLNDTIVLFDRIRENFPRMGKSTPTEVINRSVNETLSRTLMTSLTTLLVLIALFFFGGEIIHAFAWTLIVGVVVGTYSSIYVASVALLLLGVSKQDLLVIEKEGAEIDSMP